MSSAGIGPVDGMPVVGISPVADGGVPDHPAAGPDVHGASGAVAAVAAAHIPSSVMGSSSSDMYGGFNAWDMVSGSASAGGGVGAAAIGSGSGSGVVVLAGSPTGGILSDQRSFYARNRTAIVVSGVMVSWVAAIGACLGLHYASHMSADAQNALFAATAISGLAIYLIGALYLSVKRRREEAVEMQELSDRSAALSLDLNGQMQKQTIKAEILGRTNALEKHPGKIAVTALLITVLAASLIWAGLSNPATDFNHVVSFFQNVAPQQWKVMAITSGAIVGGAALFGALTSAGLYVKERQKQVVAAPNQPTFWENYGSKIKIVAGVALLASGLAVGLALKHLNVDAKAAMIVAGSVTLVGIGLLVLMRRHAEKKEELELTITEEAQRSSVSRELARDIVVQRMNQAHAGWKTVSKILLVATLAIVAFGAIYLPVHFHLHPESWDATKAAFVSAWNHTVEFFQGVYNPAIRQFFENHGWAMLETAGALTGAALLIDGIVKLRKEIAERKRQDELERTEALAQHERNRIVILNASRAAVGLPPMQADSDVIERVNRRETRDGAEVARAKANWAKLKEPNMLAGVAHIMKSKTT